MSGSSTASSSSPDTSLWGDGSGGRMQDDGLETRSQATFINISETPGYEQSREQSTAAEQHREAPANFARTDRLPGTMSGTGQAPVNPRPMSSHPSRDRKRRLTSTGEHARLQRSRSGGGHGRSVPRSEGLLPHRSVSMILPSSKSASSAAPGSSYDMAIDITSSPPGPASSASHADYPESPRNVPGESRPSLGLRAGYTSPESSKSAAGSARYPIQEAPSSFPRAYSWSEYASMDGGDEYHGHFAGNADLGSRRPGLTVHGREHAFQRGSVGSYEGFQSARGLAHRQSEDTHPSRSPRREQSTQIVPESGVFLDEDASPSTAVYHSDRRYAARGQWGVAPEVVRRGSAYGSRPSSSCYTSRSVSSRNDYLDGQEELDGMTLPRWQPDAEVSECPICGTVFSFWYRKHHCRKCGRVVCAACSPHRITIPRQFIVRPPPSTALPSSSPVPPPRPIIDLTGEDSLSSSSIINPALGGGEEVRLCNPCVPDPNPNPPGYASLRSHGHRPTHSLSSTMGNTFSPELVSSCP